MTKAFRPTRIKQPTMPTSIPRPKYTSPPAVVRRTIAPILTTSFFVTLVAGVAFAGVAEAVLGHHADLLDQVTRAWAQGMRTSSVIAPGVWRLAGLLVIIFSLICAALILLKRQRWRDTVLMLMSVIGAVTLDVILKHVFGRPCPGFPNKYVQGIDYCFPSGHALFGVVFYGTLAYILCKVFVGSQIRAALIALAALFALIIGTSRVYLGIHFLTDVVAGWLAGTCWLNMCIAADMYIEAWQRHARVR